MLIGAHVSTAGDLARGVSRASDLGCSSIRIFNQSPRAWKPTAYGEEDFAAFGEAIAESERCPVLIEQMAGHKGIPGHDFDEIAALTETAGGGQRVGLDRLRALHVNDPLVPFGSKRDRHADLGEGEIGEESLALFLSEPRSTASPPPWRLRARTKRARPQRT